VFAVPRTLNLVLSPVFLILTAVKEGSKLRGLGSGREGWGFRAGVPGRAGVSGLRFQGSGVPGFWGSGGVLRLLSVKVQRLSA
jgi:hypothetical protein